jgi:hypothetical protein
MFPETLVTTYQTARCHNPEDHCENVRHCRSKVKLAPSPSLGMARCTYLRWQTPEGMCARGWPTRGWGSAGHELASVNLVECHTSGSFGRFAPQRRIAAAVATGLKRRQMDQKLENSGSGGVQPMLCPDKLSEPSSLLSSGYRSFSHGGKAAGPWSWRVTWSSTEFKIYMELYLHSPIRLFMEWCLIKHRVNFTFYWNVK